jgi:cell wall-associated NlpC family hydrolase
MRTNKFVPCRTTDTQSSLPVTHSLTETTKRIQTYLRRSVVALAIPAALVAGSALPLANTAPSADAAISVVAADSALAVEMAALDSGPSGAIELGAMRPIVSHDAAQLALKFVGARYVYGGASPRGFDCSGLTSYVYRQLGVNLPRTARAQWANGQGLRVRSIAELQPGDLVYFARTTRAAGVTHTAVYVGNGMMVSANTPRTGVQYVSIHGSYWKSRFVGGLRPNRWAPEPEPVVEEAAPAEEAPAEEAQPAEAAPVEQPAVEQAPAEQPAESNG